MPKRKAAVPYRVTPKGYRKTTAPNTWRLTEKGYRALGWVQDTSGAWGPPAKAVQR